MAYKKEWRKILILAGIGVVLAVIFCIYAIKNYSGSHIRFGTNDYLILLAIACYPIGIVYGWREILNLYNRIRSSDREHWAKGRAHGYTALSITMLNFALAFIATICLGWIIGLLNAYKRLRYLKKNEAANGDWEN
ncbi:hypothetical protein [Cytobacillus massiliigabonensis]|uniref:hypothetical protein n=1 Tax=Cytobacillus massiliigabonensis TaxID=1871011 RepID=UPI000C824B60|nr:hypothetical protein [Cytobacillus massiliigabonensis]